MKVKKGQIINITTGSYSDYCLMASIEALKDFSFTEKAQEFVELEKENLVPQYKFRSKEIDYYRSKDFGFSPVSAFISQLIKEGFVIDCPNVQELWLGDLSEFYIPEQKATGDTP